MSKELILVRQCDLYIAVEHNALAAQTRVDARINCPVDKILFFVRYFLDIIHTLIYIYVAGAASAYPAAIVLQLNAIFQANVQNRFTFGNG